MPWMSTMLSSTPRLRRRCGAAACARNSGACRLVPIRSCHCSSVMLPSGVRIEARGVVDQQIQAAEAITGVARPSARSCARSHRSARSTSALPLRARFELLGEPLRLLERAVTVNHDIGTLGMQCARDLGADAPRRRRSRARSGRPGDRQLFMGAAYDVWREFLNVAAAQPRASAACGGGRGRACARRSRRRAAGWRSMITCGWCCTRPVWATTRPAASSSAPAGTSSPPRSYRALFARCLAVQCAALLQTVGGDVLELGAGTGRLAIGAARAPGRTRAAAGSLLHPGSQCRSARAPGRGRSGAARRAARDALHGSRRCLRYP